MMIILAISIGGQEALPLMALMVSILSFFSLDFVFSLKNHLFYLATLKLVF